MNCFHCHKPIKADEPYEVTPPDGDFFHKKCLPQYEKERDHFLYVTIHDDGKYKDWLGI